jgi:hypothetical protein
MPEGIPIMEASNSVLDHAPEVISREMRSIKDTGKVLEILEAGCGRAGSAHGRFRSADPRRHLQLLRLEHVPGAQQVLENFSRWMKPGKLIIIMIPNLQREVGQQLQFEADVAYPLRHQRAVEITSSGAYIASFRCSAASRIVSAQVIFPFVPLGLSCHSELTGLRVLAAPDQSCVSWRNAINYSSTT